MSIVLLKVSIVLQKVPRARCFLMSASCEGSILPPSVATLPSAGVADLSHHVRS
jgi:hypothetical protein